MDDSKTHRMNHRKINRFEGFFFLATFMTSLVVVYAWEEAIGHNFVTMRTD
tara:strand:+ start:363 stop:515 length:153 start_codon:yes stop_codon:yes gene_type:complete